MKLFDQDYELLLMVSFFGGISATLVGSLLTFGVGPTLLIIGLLLLALFRAL